MAGTGKVKAGQQLETIVAKLERLFAVDPNISVQTPARLRDRVTGALREHDVLITQKRGHHVTLTAIECRDRSRKFGVPEVEAFAAKCRDTGINKAFIVSSKGFTKTALKKAVHENVGCLLFKDGGESLVALTGIQLGSKMLVMRLLPRFLCDADIETVNAMKLFSDDGSKFDFAAESASCIAHFSGLPHPFSPDCIDEVWYPLPCQNLFVLDEVTGQSVGVTRLWCAVAAVWTEEPVKRRVLSYSDLLNDQIISVIQELSHPEIGTITFTMPVMKKREALSGDPIALRPLQ